MGKRLAVALAFLGWMGLVTWASLTSFQGNDFPSLDIPYLDKAVHFAFYFVATLLAIGAFRSWYAGKGGPMRKLPWIVAAVMMLYGTVIEVLQWYYTQDRTGDILDALANTAGAFCGAAVANHLISRLSGLK